MRFRVAIDYGYLLSIWKEHLQFSQMVTASGKKKIFIPLFPWSLMAGNNAINSEICTANPNPSLAACSLDQWRIPSVRALLHRNSCWIFFRQQMKNSVSRSRQSLNSPSPGETEMDLLVTRERPRRGIRNSGYDVSPWWPRWMPALLSPESKGIEHPTVFQFTIYLWNLRMR